MLLVILVVWACSGPDEPAGKPGARPGASGRSGRPSAPAGIPQSGRPMPTTLPGTGGSPGTQVDGQPVPDGDVGAAAPVPTGPVSPCTDDDITVTPATANGTGKAPSGSYPTLSLTIANVSTHACSRDLGGSQQELRLLQGTNRLWSSDDCYPAEGSDVRVFNPGVRVTYYVTWAGKTSVPGCRQARRTVPPGEYQLIGRLATKTSSPVPFKLT